MRRGLAILGVAVLLALAGAARGQTSVTLRPVAVVPAGGPVRVGDVALVGGPDAERIRAIEVPGEMLGRGRPVAVEELRRLLSEAGVNWSTTTLRGGMCVVRLVAPAGGRTPVEEDSGEPGAAPAEERIREALALRIAQILRAEPADVRVEFSPGDAELLDLAAGGRTVEVRVVGASERMSLAVTVYEEGRIIASRTIRAAVQVRRQVVLASAVKRRGEVLGERDLTRDVQWVPPNSGAVPPERAIGAAVKSRLNAGEVITEDDLTAAVVVNKGDQVMVRALAGTVSVMTRARALAPARDGELVQLAALDDAKRVMTARMEGRGRAVLVATPAMGKELER